MYYLRARLFPAILTSIPLLILVNKILLPIFSEELKGIYQILPIISSLGLSAAIIFLCVQINRLLAKEVFQKMYFKDEIKMPTTEHLLWANQFFEDTVKQKIRSKINEKFGITLMSEAEEKENEMKSRKQIVSAVSQIRNSLRENKLLLQHNIEYGFFRNLVGGALIAFIVSIGILCFGYNQNSINLLKTGIILSCLYLIPILLSKFFIKRFGDYYSRVLFEQFLTI